MSHKPKAQRAAIASAIPEQKYSPAIPLFDRLADSAFVREAKLVRSPKRPEAAAPWPISSASYWRRISEGLLPTPIKLSARVSVQRVGECRAIAAAWAAGKSDDEIRALVKALHAKRAEPAQALGGGHD